MRNWVHSPVVIPVGVLTILVLSLVAGNRPAEDTAGRPIVVYAHPPCGPELMALYRPIWAEFRRTHPNIDFRVLHITGQYEDKLKVMVAGNVAPDVIFMYPNALAGWVELDTLLPLDDMLASSALVSKEDYFPIMIDTFSYNDQLWGLPKDASADIMHYNVDLFEQYGVPKPEEDWTWDDCIAAARQLTRDTDGDGRIDIWGMTPIEGDFLANGWFTFVWGHGGEVLDADLNRCLLLEPEALEGIERWCELRWKYGVTPSLEVWNDLGGARLFELGRVAMQFAMYPAVTSERTNCDFAWDIAPMPRGPADRVTMAVGSALAVTQQSRNREAAFEFVRWMTSSEGMRGLIGVELPSCIELAESRDFLDYPESPSSKQVAVDAMKYTHVPVQHPYYFEIRDALRPEIERASRGHISAREALEVALPKVDAVLRRYHEEAR